MIPRDSLSVVYIIISKNTVLTETANSETLMKRDEGEKRATYRLSIRPGV